MNNMIIRLAMLETGLKQWQAAERAGMSEMTFSRRLRSELPEEEQQRIAKLIRGENDDD